MTIFLKTVPEKVQEVSQVIRAEFANLRDSLKRNSHCNIYFNRKGEIIVKVAPVCFLIMKAKIERLFKTHGVSYDEQANAGVIPANPQVQTGEGENLKG